MKRCTRSLLSKSLLRDRQAESSNNEARRSRPRISACRPSFAHARSTCRRQATQFSNASMKWAKAPSRPLAASLRSGSNTAGFLTPRRQCRDVSRIFAAIRERLASHCRAPYSRQCSRNGGAAHEKRCTIYDSSRRHRPSHDPDRAVLGAVKALAALDPVRAGSRAGVIPIAASVETALPSDRALDLTLSDAAALYLDSYARVETRRAHDLNARVGPDPPQVEPNDQLDASISKTSSEPRRAVC